MNNTENIIQYPEIGFVRYVHNKRAKNLSIRINQKGEVRVTIPRYVGFKKAETFLWSKKQWISHKLHEIRERSGSGVTLAPGDYITVRGKSIPAILKNENDTVEESIWRILQTEARDYLPGRVEALAKLHGFRFSGVKIRRMKSRWGSCTSKNSINLNSWLIMLPDRLSDYVILHELVHTIHRNHGPGFWETLDKLTAGDSKGLRKELRGEQIMLIHTKEKLGREGNGREGPVGP